jgi:hypothetical protein
MAQIKYEVGDWVELHDDCDLCGDLAACQGIIVETRNDGYLRFQVEEPWGDVKSGDLFWIKKEKIIDKISGNNSQFLPEPEEKGPVSIKEATNNFRTRDKLNEDELAFQLYGVDNTGGLKNEEPINKLYRNLK